MPKDVEQRTFSVQQHEPTLRQSTLLTLSWSDDGAGCTAMAARVLPAKCRRMVCSRCAG